MARRPYEKRFPDRRVPDRKTFKNVNDNLWTYRSSTKPKRKRNKPVRRNAINVNEVLATVNGNPQISTVTISAATNISATSVRRILKENGYHDYKMVLIQELRPTDFERPHSRNVCVAGKYSKFFTQNTLEQ
ncbi:hypothetical protein HHI36_002178 [Cryptolaemus montrouzieri]|uniref:Transposase Tc1-like domain-containing protein n=1 Tax=Cryptolaemus montrouzieri TaxID=559131 RepID=A0ABD2P9U8_9CUCU